MLSLWALVWLTLVCRTHGYGDGVKGVFAHYMVGTIATPQRAVDDIAQAQAAGIDAFALNVQHPDAPWTRFTLQALFAAAASSPFRLFFSLDMAVRPDPADFHALLREYLAHPAYYRHAGRPLLSTFHGGRQPNEVWVRFLEGIRSSTGTKPLFLPNFEDRSAALGAVYPPDIFDRFPAIDGILGWESAWPLPGPNANPNPDDGGPGESTNARNDEANLRTARSARKMYILPVSPYQFKHLDAENQNWFRPGSSSLISGIRRALALRPDFIELLTWNDAGEGHWLGSVWEEAITPRMAELIRGFDHNPWRNGLVAPFLSALKNGASDESQIVPLGGKLVTGAFWYRPLLKDADCGTADAHGLGKPRGWQDAEDLVAVAAVLAADTRPGSITIRVWSGGVLVGAAAGRPGLNFLEVAAGRGRQVVQVVSSADGRVLGSGEGSVEVTDDVGRLGGLCNFNYHVVEIS